MPLPSPSGPLAWAERGRLLLVAALWLVLTRLASDHGARLLPASLRQLLSLDLYLALMLLVSTALGFVALRLLSPRGARPALGLDGAPRGRSLAVSALLSPLVFVTALGLGIYVALPVLLAEFARGGAEVSRQNLGEFGRVVRQSSALVTAVWVVLLAPLGEELLFRGALWTSLRELTRPAEVTRSEPESDLEGVIEDAPVVRAAQAFWRWMREGGLATLISAGVFAAMHLGTPGGAGIILAVSTLVLGLALGLARHLSGGLFAPIALHATYNLLALGHARNWFVSETFPKDYGVPRLLTVGGLVGLLVALIVAVATRARARAAAPVAGALVLLAGRDARAGGLVGEGPQRRVEQETAVVVWDHVSHTEHLLLAARASGLKAPGGYVVALPRDAMIDRTMEGVPAAITSLLPGASPLPSQTGEAPALAPRPGGLVDLCKTWKLTCQAEPLGWSTETLGRKDLAVLPLAPSVEGPATTAYAHFRFESALPFVPFSEPIDTSVPEPEPPAPGPDHPPRVRIWMELFNESPAGRWEKQMDAAGEAQSEALAGCYAKALEQRRRLTGDVHVQMRQGADNLVSDEEERASSKPLEPVARCFASAMARTAWPKNPFKQAIRFEVHASLKPPAAAPRRLLAVVLSTHDAEPRLGDGDEPRVVPDLRPLISREPTPSELSAAFPPDARQTLGLDLSRRWRLIAFETGADPHSLRDDIQLRLLTLAAPRPGEAPLPIVTRGDRPTLPTAPPPPRWWQRRRFKLSLLALLLAALIAAVLWRDRR